MRLRDVCSGISIKVGLEVGKLRHRSQRLRPGVASRRAVVHPGATGYSQESMTGQCE